MMDPTFVSPTSPLHPVPVKQANPPPRTRQCDTKWASWASCCRRMRDGASDPAGGPSGLAERREATPRRLTTCRSETQRLFLNDYAMEMLMRLGLPNCLQLRGTIAADAARRPLSSRPLGTPPAESLPRESKSTLEKKSIHPSTAERGWRLSMASIPLIDGLNNQTRFDLQRPDRQMTPGGIPGRHRGPSRRITRIFSVRFIFSHLPPAYSSGSPSKAERRLHLQFDDRRREKERSRSHGTTLRSRSCSMPASVRVLARKLPRQATRSFGRRSTWRLFRDGTRWMRAIGEWVNEAMCGGSVEGGPTAQEGGLYTCMHTKGMGWEGDTRRTTSHGSRWRDVIPKHHPHWQNGQRPSAYSRSPPSLQSASREASDACATRAPDRRREVIPPADVLDLGASRRVADHNVTCS
ncbi:hypothetical protein CPLU01_05271 [Colletotrichum plurivorum]|uniref:Uncharacterized protein n=1 Tax=Colletotrichum plurivorum TaxID=2175906 RepID=A0A8H6NIL0_9PEZI|nr:hypothetical protein CPLU01_05271 [Colletotrichum plurivorum]